MPPASSVARLRVNCAIVIWRTVSPATGVFNIQRSIVRRPVGVRRQYKIKISAPRIVGMSQVRLDLINSAVLTTIIVTVGNCVAPTPL